MKISFNWLRELADIPADISVDDVARRLTLAGLEVEGIERRCVDLAGVVVAEVRGVRPHPAAETLRIVTVTAGRAMSGLDGTEADVVCGAANVPGPGGRVAWAPPGARLPGGRILDRREIRGVLSPGMLCSEAELGMTQQGDGILILSLSDPVGADLAAHLRLSDAVMEVNVTPNRADALSHVGIAREVAALLGTRWRLPPSPHYGVPGAAGAGTVSGTPVSIDVQIRDSVACPRYLATVVTGLRVDSSPPALRARLAAVGVRAISNVVDVTNYVLMETGHPLHAFDLDKLSGGIFVRRAAPRERITTLDGVDRALEPDDVVIADAGGPIALAGVMGGSRSEISDATTRVLLEAATFEPRAVRRTAKRLGLRSEASHRFERGVDPEGVPWAGARAAAFMAALGGGVVQGRAVDRYPAPRPPRTVSLSFSGLERLAGFPVPGDEAAARLAAIEVPSAPIPGGLQAAIPSFRPDLVIEEDLIEEVMRLCGYDRAPARLPTCNHAPGPHPEAIADRARDALAALGLHEAATWAFVPRAWLSAIGGERSDIPLSRGIAVQNPVSAEYEVMRTSLLPGLLDAVRRNRAHGVADPWLFEVGPLVRRAPEDGAPPDEPVYAAGVLAGQRPGWLKPEGPLDFFDIKQVVVELLRVLGAEEPAYAPCAAGLFLHPGLSAEVRGRQGRFGFVGQVDPRVARVFDHHEPVFYFEIELALAVPPDATRPAAAVPIPRFPSVTRDVSFWIDTAIPAASQRAGLEAAREPLLRGITVLEDFRDSSRAPPGKKGMLWTLTYRADDRTLTDAEVDAAHGRAIAALRAAYAVDLR